MSKAKHDRLLAALIAKLPTEIMQWPRADRVVWLQMMAMAFNVVYGPCGGIGVGPDDAGAGDGDERAKAQNQALAGHRVAIQTAPKNAPQRFYVDRDGFAMADGKPISVEDLPCGTVLWDERVGIECGDAGAILWRDIGTSRKGLPPSVTLRPVFDES